MFKFRSNSGQKYSPEPEQKCCSGTGTGIPVDLWPELLDWQYVMGIQPLKYLLF